MVKKRQNYKYKVRQSDKATMTLKYPPCQVAQSFRASATKLMLKITKTFSVFWNCVKVFVFVSELGIAYLYFQVVVHFETVQSGYLDKLRALI